MEVPLLGNIVVEIERDCQYWNVMPQDRTYSRNVNSINSVRVASRRICQIRYSAAMPEAGPPLPPK